MRRAARAFPEARLPKGLIDQRSVFDLMLLLIHAHAGRFFHQKARRVLN